MLRFEDDTLVVNIAISIDYESTQAIMNEIDRCIRGNHNFENIKINLTSMGGSFNYALTLYYYLRSLPKKIITVNTGFVESSAVIVFLAGDERLAYENTRFLIHEATKNYKDVILNYVQLETALKTLYETIIQYKSIFDQRTQFAEFPLDITNFLKGFSQTIILPDSAIRYGIIHKIITAQ